jgi:hypothetical protein
MNMMMLELRRRYFVADLQESPPSNYRHRRGKNFTGEVRQNVNYYPSTACKMKQARAPV